ncbi:uncharacterized protein MONBRDRAFT_22791 [Monosiga brevicollis MX1]|uniref:Small ribosomal subunit protein mS29 n=1 Tax=Monosiga brevicollis TaxID=81824 RepID=A9US35_MONBE|nr:uncharacterized protein MONBRDRAFT_22791 [Monosiga brevicollis MX1]EDQ92034.1 predicted protein [Monosiga brevicollis MX1]|eukprot:XP_001743320.1 hypothetical protein [Monosiga brevicollis MX1]
MALRTSATRATAQSAALLLRSLNGPAFVPALSAAKQVCRQYSAAASVDSEKQTDAPQHHASLPSIASSDAGRHSLTDANSMYIMTEEHQKLLCTKIMKPIRRRQVQEIKSCATLVRKDVMQALNQLNKALDANQPCRVLFYGNDGLGKTSALGHILHHYYCKSYAILPAFRTAQWYFEPNTVDISTTRPGDIDLNIDARFWLHTFNALNSELLGQMTTTKEHTLSQDIVLPQGTALSELSDMAQQNNRIATDLALIAINELLENPNRYGGLTVNMNEGLRTAIRNSQRLDKGENDLKQPACAVRMKNYTLEEVSSVIGFHSGIGWTTLPNPAKDAHFAAELQLLTDFDPASISIMMRRH